MKLRIFLIFQIYSPNIVSIETLKLERRLDEELYYLRDAGPEHSTVDPNMDPVLLAEGEPGIVTHTILFYYTYVMFRG